MGKYLVIKGADFSQNGISVIDVNNVLPSFQANALQVGKALQFSNGILTVVNSNTRVAVNKTYLNSNYTYLKIKLKTDFQIAYVAFNGNAYATSNADGTYTAGAGSWNWVTSNNEIIIPLADYNELAFNVRYSDNTTEFTSNDLTQYFEYIRAED